MLGPRENSFTGMNWKTDTHFKTAVLLQQFWDILILVTDQKATLLPYMHTQKTHTHTQGSTSYLGECWDIDLGWVSQRHRALG